MSLIFLNLNFGYPSAKSCLLCNLRLKEQLQPKTFLLKVKKKLGLAYLQMLSKIGSLLCLIISQNNNEKMGNNFFKIPDHCRNFYKKASRLSPPALDITPPFLELRRSFAEPWVYRRSVTNLWLTNQGTTRAINQWSGSVQNWWF